MQASLTETYESGFKAYPTGKNPYRQYTEKYDKWQMGFNTAKFGEMLNERNKTS